MKINNILNFLILFFLIYVKVNSQNTNNFISGEELDYKINYKIFDAASTSIKITEDKKNKTFIVDGYGKSTGTLRLFCAVDDKYTATFNSSTFKPIRLIKNVSECGYLNNFTSKFNYNKKQVEVFDKLKNTTKTFSISDFTKDFFTSFYYFRNLNYKKIKTGEIYKNELYFDETTLPSEVKILGREIIKTKFGKIRAIKISPIVQTGRVFLKTDGVFIWVSDDENLIPLKIISELKIGTVKISLEKHKNLKVPLKIIN